MPLNKVESIQGATEKAPQQIVEKVAAPLPIWWGGGDHGGASSTDLRESALVAMQADETRGGSAPLCEHVASIRLIGLLSRLAWKSSIPRFEMLSTIAVAIP
jgi:hypothetical protein